MIAIDELVFDAYDEFFNPILTELHGQVSDFQDIWFGANINQEINSLIN